MRILVISSKGRGTGCILRARSIARAFEKRGHRVVCLPAFPTLPFFLDMALDMFWYFLASLFLKCDLAIGIKPYPTLAPALFWQKIVHHAQVVLDVDDLDFAYSHGAFQTLHRAVQLPWPHRADWVTYHNPHLREPLIGTFHVPESKLVSLPQGVESDYFRPHRPETQDLPPVAQSLAEKRKPGPLLVYTAHLNSASGLTEILTTMIFLKRDLPHARLLVAGGGPTEQRYRSMARERGVEDRVFFTGMLTQPEVAACLNLADMALVYYGPGTANEHRASMKLREALACGVRIVATNVGEIRSFKHHLYLSAPDPNSFARAIVQAWRSPRKPPLPRTALQALKWDSCIQPLEKATRHP